MNRENSAVISAGESSPTCLPDEAFEHFNTRLCQLRKIEANVSDITSAHEHVRTPKNAAQLCTSGNTPAAESLDSVASLGCFPDPFILGLHADEKKGVALQTELATAEAWLAGGLTSQNNEHLQAVVKGQAVRIASMQNELSGKFKSLEKAHKEKSECEERIHTLQLQKHEKDSELERIKKTLTHDQELLRETQARVEALEKEKEDNKHLTAKHHERESRLTLKCRSLQVEVEQLSDERRELRSIIKTAKCEEHQKTQIKVIEDLKAENKKLERQRYDLVSGFMAQMRLVDILKQQRAHLEASRLLAFTEEEFMSLMDQANKNTQQATPP